MSSLLITLSAPVVHHKLSQTWKKNIHESSKLAKAIQARRSHQIGFGTEAIAGLALTMECY
jgi:hypothetical protein